MAGLKDCIRSAQRQGNLSLEEAQALYKRYDEIARRVLSPAAVREQLIKEMEAEGIEKKRRSALMETKRIDLENAITSYRDARGRPALQEALPYVIENYGEAKFQDVEHKRESILRQAQSKMVDILREFEKGALSGELRRRGADLTARMENIVRELFGQATNDARAKELAGAWTAVAEDLRQRFNAAGGAIGKLEKWGMSQVHSQEALLAAGKDKWIGFIFPLLDRERMKNPLTGERMTDAELTESLSHAYDTIVSEGWNTREPTGQPMGKGALFSRHADHRFLIFKDGDSWLNYQRNFGEADPFATMMGHLSTMSRDIAAMEVLGPNPDAMLNYLKQMVEKDAPGADDTVKALHKVNAWWAHYRGSANMPVGSRLANGVAMTRNLISAAALGSAAISSISDAATGAVARAFVGIPILKTLTGYLKIFNKGDRYAAARAGLGLDDAIHAMHRQARYIGSISGKTWSSYLNERVLSISGMQVWTQGGKHAFGRDFQALAADLSRFGWDQLEAQGAQGGAFKRSLERHGFDAASWDNVRAAPQEQPHLGDGYVGPAGPDGSGFLRPQEIKESHKARLLRQGVAEVQAEAQANALADRYLSMILRETRYAVPEPTIAARAAMVGTNQPGTFAGELMRSAGQFKSFSVTILMLHMGRVFRELAAGRKASGAIYFGALLIASTLLGAVAMQLKDIANGRDPRRMDLSKEGRKFWGAAMLQGGGLGIYGDFLFSDVNRFGGSLAGTVAGPMVERLDNLRRLTTGNLIQLSEGDKRTNFGRELVQFLRTSTPGQSLWFMRQIWERVLMDQLQYLADRDAHVAFRQQVERRKRDYGQDYWWRPGESSPRRGPDLGAMLPR